MTTRSKPKAQYPTKQDLAGAEEILLQALVETSVDVITILDMNGIVQFANPALEVMLGYQQAEIVGTNGLDLIHPQDAALLNHILDSTSEYSASISPRMELRVRFKDGFWHWMEANVKIIRNKGGLSLVALNLRDISGEKRVLQTLHQRVEELSALQATVLELSLQQDLISLLNSIVERIMTLLNSQSGFIFLFDEGANELVLAVEKGQQIQIGTRLKMGEGLAGRVAQSREPLIIDNYSTWKDRSPLFDETPYFAVVEVPMLFSGQLMGVIGATETVQQSRTYSEADARILSIFAGQAANAVHNAGLFQGLQQELVERKKMEQMLRANEERFRGIYENSTIGMYRTTPEGKILLNNPALLKMLGYEFAQELFERNLQEEGFEAGYERSNFRERIEADGEVSGFESAWRKKDGSTVFVEESAKAFYDPDGKILYYEGTVVNITERKKAENVQRAIYRISEAAQVSQNLYELFVLIHSVIAELMPARNFYIALYDPVSDLMEFPYFVDEFDSAPPVQKLGSGLTEYVLRTGKTLFANPETFEQLERSGEAFVTGSRSMDWLGVPLKTQHNDTLGVMVVQTYSEKERLKETDKDILIFVSTQVEMAIERKRSENALKMVYENLAATLDALPDLMFEVDGAGKIYNFRAPQMEKLYTSPEFFIGKTVGEVLPINAARQIELALADAKKNGVHHGAVYPLDTPAGSLWFEISIAAKGNTNLAGGNFIVLARDITERKQTEDALRESEERLRKAQTMAHVGNWELDLQSRKMWGSEEALRIYGFENTNGQLSLEQSQKSVIPAYRLMLDKAFEQLVSGQQKYDEEFQILRQTDGLIRDVHSKAEVIYDQDGRPQRIHGVIQDITERKLAENEIHRLNDELELRVLDRTARLEVANKELESFSYSVSHDLRAPLRAIDGFSRIIQEDFSHVLPADANRLLDLVRSNTHQMNHLIEDLLRFSRLSRQPISKQLIDPAALVQQALEILSDERMGRVIEIESDALPPCHGDPGLLLQVWINLLSNSIKYTRKCNKASIKISAQILENEQVIYFVRDNGVGFDMQYANKLFGVFQRLHSVEEFEGTGVGLALVNQIITRHGGRIWAEAQPGAGATFYFTL